MKASKIIQELENIVKDFGDLEVVEIDWTEKIKYQQYNIVNVSPCVVTNPNKLKEQVIIFD
jgi:hypothetical protein